MNFSNPVAVATINSAGQFGNLGMPFRSFAFPIAAASPTDADTLYVVYADHPSGNAADRGDIFMKVSTDGGEHWGSAIRVNDDRTTTDQYQPSLAVKPDGSQLFVGWYGRKNDPTGNLIDVYGRIAKANDGDAPEFQNSFQVNNESFAPYHGKEAKVDPDYMSDYDLATALNDGFYYSWSDNRDADLSGVDNEGANVYFQRIPSVIANDSQNSVTVEVDPTDNTKLRVRTVTGLNTDVPYWDTLANNTTILIDARGGDDTVTNALNVDLIAYGGSGNDTITHSTVTTGGGNDTFYGGDGADALYGGNGDDSLDGGDGSDTLDGQGHASMGDTVSYVSNSDRVVVSLSTMTSDRDASILNVENVTGSLFNDTIDGSAGNDLLDGGGDGQDVINGLNGNDTLTVYGHDALRTVDGGAGTDTVEYFETIKTAAAVYSHVNVNSTTAKVVVGSTDTVTYSNAETFLLDPQGGDDTISVTSALLSADLTINGGTGADTINVPHQTNGAEVIVDGGEGLDAVNVNSDATGSATVVFAGSQDLRLIHVFDGGTARMEANGNDLLLLDNGSSAPVIVGTDARLDVTDNDMVVLANQLTAIRNLVVAGRNGGSWDGDGIISSTARDNSADNSTLGILTALELSSITPFANPVYRGFRLGTTGIAVKYTYYGDTDLNGTINFDDYSRTDNGFNHSGSGWLNGDSDYSGVVNFDDYSRIDNAFNTQNSVLLTGPGGGGDPDLIALGQMEHFTETYMWHFIDWNAEHRDIYYTPEDFFPDGVPW